MRNRRHLLLAQIIEGAGQQHRHRAGLGNRQDAGFVEIFDVIDGKCAIARREHRAAEIGQLLGMELDGEPKRFRGLEDLLRLFDRKGDAFAEAVDRIGEACFMDGWQGLLRNKPHIAGAVVAVFRREGMGAEKGRGHLDRQAATEFARHFQHLELGFDIEPVARLDLDRGDALGEEVFQPSRAEARSSASLAARVAFTVERMPPPALAISA